MPISFKPLSLRTILSGTFIVFLVPFLAVLLFPAQLDRVMDKSSYLVFHNITEFFSIMVSLSVFSVGWFTFAQSKDRHALFLSAAFLAVGLLDFMHTMSNAAMPAFLTPNSTNKSTQFWIVARLCDASAFLVSAYIYPTSRSCWLSKKNLLAAVLVFLALVFTGVVFFPESLPATAVPGVGLTPLKRYLEFLVIILLVAAAVAYWHRLKRTQDRSLVFYPAAFIICIFSEGVFASYKTGFDTYNVLGHIYKVAAFYLIYKGVFIAAVTAPYEKLANEERIRHLASFPQLNPSPVLEITAAGEVSFANPATTRLLDDLGMGRNDVAVFLPADFNVILQDLKSKHEATLQREVVIRDRVFSEVIYLAPQLDTVRIYAVEVTARKRVEEELRAREISLMAASSQLHSVNEELQSANEELQVQSEELEAQNQELVQLWEKSKAAEEALALSEERIRRKLESIISPEGDLGTLDLADIIDAQSLQSLVDDFYRLTGMPMGLIDLEGKVLVGVGWNEICTRFHRVNPDSNRNCIESDVRLSAGVPHGEYKVYKCKNNLWDVATPVMVGDRHFGNLFMGQFFFEDEPLDYALFRAQAGMYGFDEEEYIAALEAVPRMSRETLNTSMHFFMKLADILSKLGYSNLKLARSLAEGDALMASLHESEEQFRTLADSIPNLAWWANGDGYITWYNQRWYEYTGTTPEQMEGWGWQSVHDPLVLPKVMERWQASIATGQLFEMEFPLRGADGVFRSFLTRVQPVEDAAGQVRRWFGTNTDISALKQAEKEGETTVEFLRLANESRETGELVRSAVTFFQECSGCEAVGIRLREGDDYPYYEARGFPQEFVQAENRLCSCDQNGDIVRDIAGNPVMACMCGNVICSRIDHAKPFFTAGGSFWTNSTSELLVSTSEADRQARTRNRCNGEGYESVALIPLRLGQESLGLLQLNDRQKGHFSPKAITLWERLADYLAVALAKFRAEEALRQSEERYRTLFNTLIEGFCIIEVLFDANDRPVDYRFLETNAAFETQTGLRNVQGKLMRELAPEHEAHWFEIYGKVALTGESTRFVNEARALQRWFDVSAYRIGGQDSRKVAVLFNDITEAKQAAEALQTAHNELELRIRERTEDLATTVETLLGEITERQRAEGILQRLNCLYTVLLETSQAIVRTNDRDTLLNDFCRIAVENGNFKLAWVGLVDGDSGELKIVAAAGATGYLEDIRISANAESGGLGPTGISIREGTHYICNDFLESPITRPWHERGLAHGIRASASIALKQEGQVIGAMTLYAGEKDFFDQQQEELLCQMGADLSFALDNIVRETRRQEAELALRQETFERRQAMEALCEKEQLLIQQSRQAAMGEMIGNIAHQWRQPLNTLGLTIQRLLLFYDLGRFTRESLENDVNSSMVLIQHMSKTIDDFRNYFRPDKEKVEFRVRESIEDTLSLLEGSFQQPQINIEIIAKDNPVINGYRNEFCQVLLNILINARDVLCERETDEPTVTITIGSDNDRAVVTVADNAGGIPEEIMDKVFDPYFTTKGPQQGTGVGLFMSKAIIEKNMGGRLSVRNTAQGAEFKIEVGNGNHA